MRILICGLGSIGQRHVRLLRTVLGEEADIWCHRVRGLNLVISDSLGAQEGRPEEHYGLRRFESLADGLRAGPDAVFVTNPISMHIETALAAVRQGCHVFVEKPLSHSRDGVAELRRAAAEHKRVVVVGYQLRFHPAIRKIRDLLRNRAIGSVVSAQVHFGEWLPGMHPYEDYRESHAARRDQGGGVILCLSHEIDYACWLFGRPKQVFAIGGHLSDLELDGVEDTAELLVGFEDNGREIPVSIHLDFVSRPPRRFCRITGERGHIEWDHYDNVVTLHSSDLDVPRRETFDGFRRNDMFVAEIEDFVAAVESGAPPTVPLTDGATTLDVCLAAKESMAERRIVRIPTAV
jgi:predicted dehydrogenase